MESSRIGSCLRTARERAGWSRETLAHRSGVSWSAIAQIESGRRKDVRQSSLLALAGALRVTVDYLIGVPADTQPLLEHRVLPYATDEEFISGSLPLLADGVERGHATLAVTTSPHIAALRDALHDALGDRADGVAYADSSAWYVSPTAALTQYRDFVNHAFAGGAPWVHVIGEPVWDGRTAEETSAWTRYESIINIAFANSPATIVCPYDVGALAPGIVSDAHRTHPEVTVGRGAVESSAYREPERFLLDA